jgi:CubicO group peptidase (beta-lactamase class C family)
VSCALFPDGSPSRQDLPLEWVSNNDPAYKDAVQQANALIRQQREAINVPSYSAAVAVGGEIVWAGATGWADIANGLPATPETTYRIGSTSKAITASLTGRLLDKGIVDLDTPISAYVPGLPSKWRQLTLRQLHSHTAGLPGYENNRDRLGQLDSFVLWTHYDDVADALAQFDDAPLIFEPGTDFYYSSFDVVLASAVLQAAAGTPFPDLVKREVFLPVGMKRTAADGSAPASDTQAVSYGSCGRRFCPWRHVDLSSKLAAGGFASTSSDLVRLGAAYLHGSFLSDETVKTLWTPQVLRNGKINPQTYALGWRSERAHSSWHGNDLWIVHHGGISKGTMSWLVIYPDLDIVIALNANARAAAFSDFSAPSAHLAELFYRARLPQPVQRTDAH